MIEDSDPNFSWGDKEVIEVKIKNMEMKDKKMIL
jgi:hypothetical protein